MALSTSRHPAESAPLSTQTMEGESRVTETRQRYGTDQDSEVGMIWWILSPFVCGLVGYGIVSVGENPYLWQVMPSTIRNNPRDFWTIIASALAAALGPFYSERMFEGFANVIVMACLANQYRACFWQVVALQIGLPLSVLTWLAAQHILVKLVPEDEKGLQRAVAWLTACVSILAVSKLCAVVQAFRGNATDRVRH